MERGVVEAAVVVVVVVVLAVVVGGGGGEEIEVVQAINYFRLHTNGAR